MPDSNVVQSLKKLIFDSSGTDATLLTKLAIFFSVLSTLKIVKNGWPADKLGSETLLQERTNWYKQMFEGGLSGNKGHIAARRQAREEMVMRVQQILQYLEVMADESDITTLVNAGVVVLKSRKRSSRRTVPVTNG